jgi:hypothetical protein
MILKDAILETNGKIEGFGKRVGMSQRTLFYKLKNNTWSVDEAVKVLLIIGKNFNEINEFTTPEYRKMVKMKIKE